MKPSSIVIVLLTCTTAASLFWAYTLSQRLTETEARLAEKSVLEAKTLPLNAVKEASEKNKTISQADSSARPEPKENKDQSESNVIKENMEKMAKGLSKMMKDPSMKDAMKVQFSMQIDLLYRDLFDELGLSEEKEEQLKALLVDRLNSQGTIGMSFLDEQISKEDKDALLAEIKKSTDEANAKIKEFFSNPEDYDKLQRYEDSQQERMFLKQLRTEFTGKGLNLSEKQETDLMAALYQERKNMKFDVDFANQKPENLAHLNPEEINKYTEKYDLLLEKQKAAAAKILDEKQMQAFDSQVQSQKKMQEMGLKMFQQIMKSE